MSISIRDLLDAGAHFGHQTHRWNPKMKPYIYGQRNGIYIIDLQQTAKLWVKANDALVQAIRSGQKVLFVGTKPQAQEVIREEAVRADQFYVNKRWLGGMLTNFKTIRKGIERLEELEKIFGTEKGEKLHKKELVVLRKEHQKLEKSLMGIKKMSRLPALVVVVDPNREHLAVVEANKLNIPVIAITDTNCNPDNINYVVPANDDALKSVKLFIAAAADACLEGQKAFELRIQQETRQKMEKEKQNGAKAPGGESVEADITRKAAANETAWESMAAAKS
jgi:small subunit ribosomal protein S2